MTQPAVPDWLAERVALGEVPAASQPRVDRADPQALAEQVSALRADDARELAAYPTGPAVAQLDARVAAEVRRRQLHVRRRVFNASAATIGIAAVVLVAGIVLQSGTVDPSHTLGSDDGVRAKGSAHLIAFRRVGDRAEHLDADAVVREGDVLQLRYNAGGARYGLIASIDGAGTVTLHYPAAETAAAEATAVAGGTVALPQAYQLDDAPGFERFFFVTASAPIDVTASIDLLRRFAQRDDAADADLELPSDQHQTSLRLRKPAPSGGTP